MAITQNTYTGDGSTVSYSFTFPYLEETDIKVSLNGVVTTAYTLSNATTVTFSTAPANGAAIRIYRDTNNDALAATFFAGSAIRAQDLNEDFLQNAYVTQEVKARYLDTQAGGTISNNVTITGDLSVTGDVDINSGTLDMNNNRIINVATATASTDAANKAYVDTYIQTLYQGPQATDPTTRLNGSPLEEGDLYFNTTQDILKAWTGTEWVISAAAGNIIRWRKTAVGGETTLSGNDDLSNTLDYVVGNEQVYLNGALQTRGVDYTTPTSGSITLTPALTAGDVVELHAVQGYVSATVTDGSITSAKIADDTIVNADVNSAAGIVATKLSFTQTGTGATARTIDSKLKDVVSVKDFGAVGNGTTDDATAINNAFNYIIANGGTLYFPPGTYRTTGSFADIAVTSTHSVKFLGEDAVIEFDPGSYLNFGFCIQCNAGSALRSVVFEGLTLNCNNDVATAIRVNTTDTKFKYIGVKNCIINNCFQDSTISTAAVGISASDGDVVEIIGNRIETVSRNKTGASGVCSGISCTRNLNTTISNNYIKNINYGTGDAADADGIKYFDTNTSSYYSRDKALISDNTIIDCAGRFVKLQTGGHCVVSNNHMKIESAVALITNWKGVDSQTGYALVENNKISLGDTWTGGSSSNLFSVQAPLSTNVTYSYELAEQIFRGNVVTYKAKPAYAFLIGAPDATSTATYYVEISSNIIQGNQNPAGNSTTNVISDFINTVGGDWPTPASMQGSVVWNIRDNVVHCYEWVNFRSSGAVDYTGKWLYYFVNNIKTPTEQVRNLWSSGNIYTSNFQISGCSGNVYCTFDFQKLLPGCNFNNGSGARTNGPANYSFRSVIKSGSTGYQVWSNAGIYTSYDATTWSALIV